jgi:lipoyl(octanoyl) transferase
LGSRPARDGPEGRPCYRAGVDVAAPTLDPGPARDPVAGGPLEARWLGRIGYRDAWALQHELVERRIAGELPDQLLLLEHPAVLTLGRNAEEGHVRASAGDLAARGIEVIRVERGGEVTYHGPGQLVAYPILALSRRGLLLRPMVRALEAAMVDTCAAFGVIADRREGHPGCWCDGEGPAPRKIGALGIRVERGVSYHGIALNIDPDLADFDLIDPCGMPEVVSTSIALELGARELGARELGARELGVARTTPAQGFRGDARRGITPGNRDLTLSDTPIPSRFDARLGITGTWDSAEGSGLHVGVGSAPSGWSAGTADTDDAPRGISEGVPDVRFTHDEGALGGDAPRGIGRDPHAPEPSVEWAARVFARALAERLGAKLVLAAAGSEHVTRHDTAASA